MIPVFSTPACEIFGFDFGKSFMYENGFWHTSSPSRIGKSLAHYELYKKVINLPGEIVECGVFKGTSLMKFIAFRELLENQLSRAIVGFDAFGKFPDQVSMKSDKEFIKEFEAEAGDGISEEELEKILAYKRVSNVFLVKGLIPDTFSVFFEKYPSTQIALLHIDVDVYEATKACLDNLYERVVRGGVIIFDDYGQIEGATKAINEFIKSIGKNSSVIQKLPYNYVPAFMVKE